MRHFASDGSLPIGWMVFTTRLQPSELGPPKSKKISEFGDGTNQNARAETISGKRFLWFRRRRKATTNPIRLADRPDRRD